MNKVIGKIGSIELRASGWRRLFSRRLIITIVLWFPIAVLGWLIHRHLEMVDARNRAVQDLTTWNTPLEPNDRLLDATLGGSLFDRRDYFKFEMTPQTFGRLHGSVVSATTSARFFPPNWPWPLPTDAEVFRFDREGDGFAFAFSSTKHLVYIYRWTV